MVRNLWPPGQHEARLTQVKEHHGKRPLRRRHAFEQIQEMVVRLGLRGCEQAFLGGPFLYSSNHNTTFALLYEGRGLDVSGFAPPFTRPELPREMDPRIQMIRIRRWQQSQIKQYGGTVELVYLGRRSGQTRLDSLQINDDGDPTGVLVLNPVLEVHG